MFRRSKNLTVATTLVVLLTMVAVGLTPTGPTAACSERVIAKPAACSPVTQCCCGSSSTSKSCCCRRKDTPTQLPPRELSDAGSTLKWTPCSDVCISDLTIDLAGRTNGSLPHSFFTPLQRSVQSRLCIWRN